MGGTREAAKRAEGTGRRPLRVRRGTRVGGETLGKEERGERGLFLTLITRKVTNAVIYNMCTMMCSTSSINQYSLIASNCRVLRLGSSNSYAMPEPLRGPALGRRYRP